MILKTAANILDNTGDYKSADIIDDLLIKQAASPAIKPSILQPQVKPVNTPIGLTQTQVINPNIPKVNQVNNKGNFNNTIDLMFKLEGGKTDEKTDRGGRTNLGITQREFDAWNKKNNLPLKDVFNIDRQTASQIFKEGYWNIIKGDELPVNVAKAMMNMALLDGPQDSIKFTQKILGLKPDGLMGPMTIQQIWAKSKNGDFDLAQKIINRQIDRYKNDEQAVYRDGWVNRANQVIDSFEKPDNKDVV